MVRNLKPNKAMAGMPALQAAIGGTGAHFIVQPLASGETLISIAMLCGHRVQVAIDQTDRDSIVRLLHATMDANDYHGLAGGRVFETNTCSSAGLPNSHRRS